MANSLHQLVRYDPGIGGISNIKNDLPSDWLVLDEAYEDGRPVGVFVAYTSDKDRKAVQAELDEVVIELRMKTYEANGTEGELAEVWAAGRKPALGG